MRLVLIAGVVAAFGIAAGNALAAPTTRFVSNGPATKSCGSPHYNTIQDAINASSPGDTVRVCPGSYAAATVNVAGLTLIGSNNRPALKGCARKAGEDFKVFSIVHGSSGTPGFDITADDVTISGFTVRDAVGTAGIHSFNNNDGVTIKSNIIDNNSIGIAASSSAAPAVFGMNITGNCIVDNNVSPGGSHGTGIYGDIGLNSSTISGNMFQYQQNNGLVFEGGTAGGLGTFDSLTVSGNISKDDAPFNFASDLTNSTITGNTSLRSAGSGIFFGGAGDTVSVTKNKITDCVYTGINVTSNNTSYGDNNNFMISGNTVTNCGDAGIRIRAGTHDSTIQTNTTNHNGYGPYAGSPYSCSPSFDCAGSGISNEDATGPTNNSFLRNSSSNNHIDGLFNDGAGGAGGGNTWTGNSAFGNVSFDCEDLSTGTSTAGTDDFWSFNKGIRSNPAGLCNRKGTLTGG